MAKTDRELLELAAKAAGYEVFWEDKYDAGHTKPNIVDLAPEMQHFAFVEYPHRVWDPLNNGADAMRLAVALNMVTHSSQEFSGATIPAVGVGASHGYHGGVSCNDEPDQFRALCRAIVLCAANYGEAHP